MLGVAYRSPKFLSTPSARRATCRGKAQCRARAISIHALREEGDRPSFFKSSMSGNFYPRPPRGGRRVGMPQHVGVQRFLSTPSARRATVSSRDSPRTSKISIHALREEGDAAATLLSRVPSHFYPRPPRGGRPSALGSATFSSAISIHALREEGDLKTAIAGVEAADFYPRPPRGGRRRCRGRRSRSWRFLSTPSARRAT